VELLLDLCERSAQDSERSTPKKSPLVGSDKKDNRNGNTDAEKKFAIRAQDRKKS